MTILTESNVNYNDFSSLSQLRVDARNDSEGALKKVAKQFESVFVQMMLKSMREASVPLQGELFHGNESEAYTDMYDKQLSLELSGANGIGLADSIVRQLSSDKNIKNTESLPSLSQPDLQSFHTKNNISQAKFEAYELPLKSDLTDKIETKSVADKFEFEVSEIKQSPHWNKAEDFIKDSWPHAQRAAKELGVDPRVIMAQSVLETGWGKKVHFTDNGENSYSLFGIKANADWQGKKVQFNTLEFESGAMNRQRASFRAYDSLSESYQDYVQFLKNSPRYQNVLNAETSKEYSQQLQQSGYATDPEYAEKIERITKSKLMNQIISELKISSKEPLV